MPCDNDELSRRTWPTVLHSLLSANEFLEATPAPVLSGRAFFVHGEGELAMAAER